MSTRGNVVGRNDPCPCGSGRKYKQCCEAKASRMSRGQLVLLAIVTVILVGGLVLAVTNRDHEGRPAGVWSEEHGHYH